MADLTLRQCDFTVALANLILFFKAQGYRVKIQELNRTVEQQREYVTSGVSKTMDSRHLDKLAADLILVRADGTIESNPECYRAAGDYWEHLGGRWGGRFGLEDQPQDVRDRKVGWDPDHFEFRKEA